MNIPRLSCLEQKSLEVLNISGNRIDNIADLIDMRCLTQFMAGDNLLVDTQQVGPAGGWGRISVRGRGDGPASVLWPSLDLLHLIQRVVYSEYIIVSAYI